MCSSCGGRHESSLPFTRFSTSTAASQSFTETYDDGTDVGKWIASFSVPRTIEPAGGSPLGGGIPFGAYLQQGGFPSSIPTWGTASARFQPGYNDTYKENSVFVGDWTAAGVTTFGVDLDILQSGSWPSTGRPVTMQLLQMDSTGFSVTYSATYTTPIIAKPPVGWTRYTFAIDARGGVIPPGWVFRHGDGTPATDAEWATFLSQVDATSVGYYAPGTFYPSYGSWTLGIDNITIQTSTAAAASCSGTMVEDDDSHIAYSNGWHSIDDSDASAGHFRLNEGGNNQHTAIVNFSTPAAQTGTIRYFYATSTKGGSAEVFVDGQDMGPVNYNGSSGSDRSPVFGASKSYSYGITTNGQHTLEIQPLHDGVYIDGFCLDNATPVGTPSAYPGSTSKMNFNLSQGQAAVNSIALGAGTQAISIVAESNIAAPIQLLLIDPSGAVVQTVNTSTGVAVLDAPITQSGVYAIKVVNVGLGPLQIWSVATALVSNF